MKVVLIGDSSVGKSALVHRFIYNQPLATPKATVGIAFIKQTIINPDTGEEFAMQIWDTAGQEKFQSVTTHHYRMADGALLVFDVASESSFRNLDRWLNELHENTDPSVVVCVVATKMDLGKRVITEERARAYAQGNGLLYAETSSMWDKHTPAGRGAMMGIEKIFLTLVQTIARRQRDMGGQNPGRLDRGAYGGDRGGKTLTDEDFQKRPCEC